MPSPAVPARAVRRCIRATAAHCAAIDSAMARQTPGSPARDRAAARTSLKS